jgi:hypothetical protein
MVMLSSEERNRIADFFEPWELVQLLLTSKDMEDLIDFLEEEIEEALDDLNEIMEFDNGPAV